MLMKVKTVRTVQKAVYLGAVKCCA